MMRRVWILLVALLLIPGAVPRAAAGPPGDIPKPFEPFLSAMEGGNTVEAKIRETAPRADGFRHIDTPATIHRLQQMHATMYTFGIWDKATDWDDLRLEFAPAAARAGIDVMVYLVPPSECFRNSARHLDGRCSRPFDTDYVRWATEIAKLSLTYPNLKSWAIDDFLAGPNGSLFTKDYLGQVRAAMNAVNPHLKWYVTLYSWDITPATADRIKGALDGVIFPYTGYINNSIDPTWLEPRLDSSLDVLRPAGLNLVLLAYTGRFLDGMIHPDERYVADVLRRATPYLTDGRLDGIIAYGAPLRTDLQQPSWDYWGYSGNGRLSLSVGNFTATVDGSYAAASQQMVVSGNGSRSITFRHRDPDVGGLRGYQFKQVLVDDQVVWQSDVEDDPKETWITTTVDLTAALQGKTSAKVTFRLFDQRGVGWWPLDWSIDDVSGRGVVVRNGGFEQNRDWELSRNYPTMQPYIDIYSIDRPARIFDAIGTAYAGYRGQSFVPVQGPRGNAVRIGPNNRAMYGNGRLAFTVPNGPVPANTCATATQQVRVKAGQPRYELSFWHADPEQARFGEIFKQLRIDGQLVWDRDAGDYWPWFYLNGSDHQGGIDVTDFVQGKPSVSIQFGICTKQAVTSPGVVVGFDHVEGINLDIHNPGFENRSAWSLTAGGPLKAAIDIAR
ncbi:hypothetical protein JOF29_005931 [Kribbella aluminosa]|uniref:Uncharacterized protein n=1 Tax=Kribbella aluminosa TaxID=416017 RepID=A0ABS4UTE0_9ACTN|nr:hypothetical protein [Kribbella aluminosa]MBP2354821.1 hypothetical protein [Kribbella aluminosa]